MPVKRDPKSLWPVRCGGLPTAAMVKLRTLACVRDAWQVKNDSEAQAPSKQMVAERSLRFASY